MKHQKAMIQPKSKALSVAIDELNILKKKAAFAAFFDIRHLLQVSMTG
ncbi:hypothetical protein SAR116_2431 [Candidatus Puniceispirillum marinum IMCC1322]|uniref:Uncharacterized protein n=1 Tax=Puniceispirillum marinum (strain IMCC1322) TaxID=488538 RepID=D5BQF7_PUNMI|nr:hypothetical protein SAR116_2431 [Candidatus Puniceispirillum marinum IMCC1322]